MSEKKYANFEEFNERIVDLIQRERDVTKISKDIQDITSAENPEFKLFYQRAAQALKNLYPDYANERGLRAFEEWLGVSPESDDTKEDRIFRIKSKYNQQLPYTYIHLHKMLAVLCGWEGFTLELDDFVLSAFLTLETNSQVGSVYDLLLHVVPANVLFRVVQYINEKTDLQTASFLQLGERLEIGSVDNSPMIAKPHYAGVLRDHVKVHIGATPLKAEIESSEIHIKTRVVSPIKAVVEVEEYNEPKISHYRAATLRNKVKVHIPSTPMKELKVNATESRGSTLRNKVKVHVVGTNNKIGLRSKQGRGTHLRERIKLFIKGDNDE